MQSNKTKHKWMMLVKRLMLLVGLYVMLVILLPGIQGETFFSTACLITILALILSGGGYGNQRLEALLTKDGNTLMLSYGTGKITIPVERVESIAIGKNYLGLIEKNNSNGYDIMCKGSREQIHHHIKNVLGAHFKNCTVQRV
ncbi:hypothetical protein [Pseudoalteromonas piscicida]|uniref:hypothetical protein n=1 Tax=Pseudoalteromonas piscicida TaxID=43662 RepID=UPI0030AECBA0